MAVKKIETIEEVVHDILRKRGSCIIGPFASEEEAIRVMATEVLPSVWCTLDRSQVLHAAPRPPMTQPVVMLRRNPAGRATEVAMVPKLQLAHGTKVYTVEGLMGMIPVTESEQPAPEEQTHPRIGGEYFVRYKETGGLVTSPRKVLAFDHEEGPGRTYVWYQFEKGRATCVLQELEWIPANGKEAILVKAMHAAGLNKGQRKVILAAFKELTLIEGETHE